MTESSRPPTPLRVVIADDEPLARLLLRQRLQRCQDPQALVVGEAGNAGELLKLLSQQACDAVLLDIRMPGSDGLQLAQQLMAWPQAPAVIFVTAHAEHALQAFEVEAVDYLTKPVAVERLQQALRRVNPRPAPEPPARQAAASPLQVLSLVDRQQTLRIPLNELIMARAGDKRVLLTTLSQEHFTDESLAELEPRLGAGFVRIHRNAIVALHAVRELRHTHGEDAEAGWMVRLVPGDHWLPVSRRQLPGLRAALASNHSG
jgi:two-component system, LytTR family, response regulator AlgR